MNSQTIAFRVKAELIEKLDKECHRLNAKRSDLVRAIVEEHLANRSGSLREELKKLQGQLKRVHRNQARSLVSLLIALGRVPLEDAKEIARADLLS